MSIRLAASKPVAQLRLGPVQMRQMRATCANDNSLAAAKTNASAPFLHAALRHFATHGMASAQRAAEAAQAAHARRDETAYRWWRDICQTFDRRLASTLDQGAKDHGRAAAPR